MATKKQSGPVYVRARGMAFYNSSRVRQGQVVALSPGDPVPAWGEVVESPNDAGKGDPDPPALATMSDLTHGRVATTSTEVPPTTREAAERQAGALKLPRPAKKADTTEDLLS